MSTDAPSSMPEAGGFDAHPTVPLRTSTLPRYSMAVLLVVLGILLFVMLDQRRRNRAELPARAGPEQALIQSPPPLVLPPEAAPDPSPAPPPRVIVTREMQPPRIVYVPAPAPPQPMPPAPARAMRVPEPALVIDTTLADANPAAGDGAAAEAAKDGGIPAGRARATFMRNRSTTVPQGSLIPAVLETAFDSSRPGMARAIVSEDMRGFDGDLVLIPRGSRLVGEYRADATPGQRRAVITWTRLIRPDGATIALGSPSGDTLGRGGITGSVDTHFLQRFGGAILQTALDIGVNLATAHAAGNNVILGVNGSFAGSSGSALRPEQIPPTIRVRQGTAITIFVARDLDFTAVERRR
jgi:type IV secretion system protein VirB10